MVTIREDGRERRVTAAEVFLLHLTKRGLDGDSAAARASLLAIEAARAVTGRDEPVLSIIRHYVSPGSVGTGLDALGLAVKLNRYSAKAYYKLEPWIVQAALARLQEVRLTPEEQEMVLNATHHPEKAQWPNWWSYCPSSCGRQLIGLRAANVRCRPIADIRRADDDSVVKRSSTVWLAIYMLAFVIFFGGYFQGVHTSSYFPLFVVFCMAYCGAVSVYWWRSHPTRR
jgi:hypothetical protein